MVYLHQITNHDFVAIYGDATVAQAIAVVQRRMPTAVVVCFDHQYYLYRTQEFLKQLAGAAEEQGLEQALQLNAAMATAALDLYENAELTPDQCVVVSNQHLVGFYDVSIPPQQQTRRDESRADKADELVARSLHTSFPEQVMLGNTVSLLVSLARKLGQKLAGLVAIGSEVDIVVQTNYGFTIVGPDEGRLTVTDEDETLPIQFKLRATAVGPAQIRVCCFQGGQALGAITLSPTVVAADTTVTEWQDRQQCALAPFPVTQPDLSLLIFEKPVAGQTEITFRLTALDPDLNLYFKEFGPIRLRMEPLHYFQEFFRDIEGLSLTTAEERRIASRKLAGKGARLFQDLLPEALRTILWSLREQIQTVQILSDEPWIPWELLRLHGKENGKIVEGSFFCDAFAMTRWTLEIGRRPRLYLKHIALIFPEDSGLPHAAAEWTYLRSLNNEQRKVSEIRATYLDVIDALSQGEYDGWHFCGHGEFVAWDPGRSAIKLEQGRRLCAEEICGQVSNCGATQPLVFLNSCQTGQQAFSLTGSGGWAQTFLEAGAAAFIGTLWSVEDKCAYDFARAFYGHLLTGESIAQATRHARQTIQPQDELTWLAYTVFADPFATVVGQSAGQDRKVTTATTTVKSTVQAGRAVDPRQAEIESLQKRLSQHHQNLRQLLEQKTLYGAGEEPLHLLNQIAAEEQAIASSSQKLESLRA